MRQIEKPSFLYSVLFRMVKFYFHLFYRKITITGKEKVPLNAPLIFASNHQNALMDALAILFAANRPVVFLARADIFNNKKIASILNFLKILPVYRIRDGVETMGNNARTFDDTVRILETGTPLGILPEGAHSPIKRLQPLKKGICRIAFKAAESYNFKSNIQLVPVGLDYSSYQQAGTHLLINFGCPIHISAYYDLYRENPQKAISRLRDDLAVAMKQVMIHIENVEHYHTIISLAMILEADFLKKNGLEDCRENRFIANREIIGLIETAVAENRLDLIKTASELESYERILRKNRLNDRQLSESQPSLCIIINSLAISILLSPVHLYGMIINYLPYKIPVFVSGKIKDPQFISSVNFGLSFFLFPVWYFVLFIASQFFCLTLPVSLLLLISWPATGLFSFYYFRHFKKLVRGLQIHIFRKKNPALLRELAEFRMKIIDLTGPTSGNNP